jgi:redox-sensitive bicupin YhaK (pirin superfamily)
MNRDTIHKRDKYRDSPVRTVIRMLEGVPATDGAGVQLTRMIGTPQQDLFDPFLLLDVIRSEDPDDYLAGFPPHPHRGFETVSYLLAGHFRHRDSTGHESLLTPGGVQWMSAGRGIVHSEMPEQLGGRLEGFQLWINLPAAHKMDPPAYQDFGAEQIPLERAVPGARIRVVAGRTLRGTLGPVRQPLTDPLFLDVVLAAQTVYEEALPQSHNAFLYQIQGESRLAEPSGRPLSLRPRGLALLSRGERLRLSAGAAGARFLLVAGRPLGEPVARGGPFVMNTRREILQAFRDFQEGRFGNPQPG